MLIRNARFTAAGNLGFNVRIDNDSNIRIWRQQKTHYTRRLTVQPHLWYDASHQRIINAMLELEEALRLALEETN